MCFYIPILFYTCSIHPTLFLTFHFDNFCRYYNFVKYLVDRPFYGIQSSQLVPRVEGVTYESVQQLAEKYILITTIKQRKEKEGEGETKRNWAKNQLFSFSRYFRNAISTTGGPILPIWIFFWRIGCVSLSKYIRPSLLITKLNLV
jgi:hypothetical protein